MGRVLAVTFIIAEVGTSFADQDPKKRLDKALYCVGQAARADAVKFQMFISAGKLFCPMPGDEDRWPRWHMTDMPLSDWIIVAKHCRDCGVEFMASAFQEISVLWLQELGVKHYKVASRAAAAYPYHLVPGPFIVSCGLGPQLNNIGKKTRQFLDCVMKYPTPLAEARWKGGRAGLSDHSGQVWPGLDAIFRGAQILEVHVNIPPFDSGPDGPVCLELDDLRLLCEARDAAAEMRPHSAR